MRKVYVVTGTFENGKTFIVGVFSSKKKAAHIQDKMIYRDPYTTFKIETEVLL